MNAESGQTAPGAPASGAPESVAPAPAGLPCANCTTPLAGPYCHACGQRHHDHPVHHFGHFVREATADLTHADSRLWQTLVALLFRPGFLTREFLEGRRARYLSPVRLYLVVSVIFFVVVGLNSRISRPVHVIIKNNGNSFQYRIAPAHMASGAGPVALTPARIAGGAANGLLTVGPTRAEWQRVCGDLGTYIEQHGGWLASFGPRLAGNCLEGGASGGPEHLRESVEHNLERAMILFLPLLALVMKPLYLKPPRHYVEHLLFFLYNHAFLFVVLGLSTLVGMITSAGMVLDPIDAALAIYVAIYFYRAMRRVYGQGGWLTLSKLSALAVAYFLLGLVMLVGTLSYSILTL